MKLSFEPRARAELVEAARYYRAEAGPSVAEAFSQEFQRTVAKVLENPEAGAVVANRRRRYLFHKFPYSLIYRITEDGVHIVAVAHQSRRPNYWARPEVAIRLRHLRAPAAVVPCPRLVEDLGRARAVRAFRLRFGPQCRPALRPPLVEPGEGAGRAVDATSYAPPVSLRRGPPGERPAVRALSEGRRLRFV